MQKKEKYVRLVLMIGNVTGSDAGIVAAYFNKCYEYNGFLQGEEQCMDL